MSIYHVWMPTWNDYIVESQMATHEYQNNIPHETKKMWFECKPQHTNQTPPNTHKSHTMHISKQHRCNTTQHSNIWQWTHQIQIVNPIGSANSLELPQQPFTICLIIPIITPTFHLPLNIIKLGVEMNTHRPSRQDPNITHENIKSWTFVL
jgi:hypothetical protein